MTRNTSKEAYFQLLDSGKIKGLRALMVECFINHPLQDFTTNEFHKSFFPKRDKQSVTPRMIELYRMGFIRESVNRYCHVTGRNCVAWIVETPENFGKPRISEPSSSEKKELIEKLKIDNIILERRINELESEIERMRKYRLCLDCERQLTMF